MNTAVLALTQEGARQGVFIARGLGADLYVKTSFRHHLTAGFPESCLYSYDDFQTTLHDAFLQYEGLVCVMACGIVVRSLAPYLEHKTKDPAVVVMDERGQFVISLLSGHMGGANDLARAAARLTGGTPVITTATDVQGLPAFDELAVKNHCAIENMDRVKHISSALLAGETVYLYADVPFQGTLPPHLKPWKPGEKPAAVVALTNGLINAQTNQEPLAALGEKVLILRPRNLVLGIGCRKGKSAEAIQAAVTAFLNDQGKSPLSLRCLASISLKAEEPGLLTFAAERDLPFLTFTAEEIATVEAQCAASDFVRHTTGVGSVAEACAMLAGKPGQLIAGKTVFGGITLALWEEDTVFQMQPGEGRTPVTERRETGRKDVPCQP